MSMALFLKAMFLLLLTGPVALSRRLKPEALSQAIIVKDSQPNKVDEVGCPQGGCPSAKPEGETKKKKVTAGGILNAVKDAAQGAAVKVVTELVKHHQRNNDRKTMWPTPPAEKAREANEVQVRRTSTDSQDPDHYDATDKTTEPETLAAEEEPEQEPKARPTSPTTSEEESEVPASLTPAEEAYAKWAAASPAMETAAEPAEESEESPAKEAAEEPAKDAKDKKESFAQLSTAPFFPVFFVAAAAAALEIGGAK